MGVSPFVPPLSFRDQSADWSWESVFAGGDLPPAGEHSSPLRSCSLDFVGAICDRPLCRGVQHVFNEDAVAHGGVVDKDVGHRAHQFAVLDNGAAGHECVKYRTKFCTVFGRSVMNIV